jgi:transcriptional antiterminator NusG
METETINARNSAGDTTAEERRRSLEEHPWYVVHVRSRHEFVAHDELRRRAIGSFLPTVRKTSRWKDRTKTLDHPLFPGYIFVQVPARPGSFHEVLKTRGVVGFITLGPGQPTPVLPGEIESLMLMVGGGGAIDIYPHLKEGMRVRVKKGPLENAEGFLWKKENECCFSINVEILGRSVAVKIAAGDLEAA